MNSESMSVAAHQNDDEVTQMMLALGQQARQAARAMAAAPTGIKNEALQTIADGLMEAMEALQKANRIDLENGKTNGLSPALLDRLELTVERIEAMAQGLRQIAQLPDPVAHVNNLQYRPSGIQVGKMRVPLGVIGIIYESRPNVTADAAGLCLKSGNATILRGGSEAIESNQAIAHCIGEGLKAVGLPRQAVQVVETTDRRAVGELIRLQDHVDVIVPRGGKGLIERISKEATVPVIKHLDGICHVYIDNEADLEKAIQVAFNSKTQRYGTCNTMETLLVGEGVATSVLPELCAMFEKKGVELRGCKTTCGLIPTVKAAQADDWSTEYLAPILSIRVVKDLNEAIDHIETYSSRHTDAIITENFSHAQRFLREVDSSSVMVNASTRFADGFEYGLGAEIGISTDKLHARGPVGLEGLTTEKFIVLGDGQVRT